MTPEILILLLLLAVAVVLFATEVVPVDVAGIALVLGLYATGLVSGEEVSRGFGNEVILFLGSLFVLTEGLVRTGVLDALERSLAGVAVERPGLLLLLLVVGVGTVSAFLSNTATTAAFLPVAVALSRRLQQAPSKLLMPLAFASILGGTCTLIGTSTNVVVSGMLPRFGLRPLSLFELAPVGLPVLVVGTAYLLTVGRRLLPERGGEPLDVYGVRAYLGEVVVPPGSPWVGKRIAETRAGRELDVNILGLVERPTGEAGPAPRAHRGARRRDLRDQVVPIPPDRPLREGDVLLVEAPHESLLRLKNRRELGLVGDFKWGGAEAAPVRVHEILLAPRSRLSGKSLRQHQFRYRYNVTVLAIFRRGQTRHRRLADLPLRDGDVLLVQGDLDRLEWLLRSGDLILLEQMDFRPRGKRAWVAVGAFLGMVAVGAAGWLPFSMAALGAAGLLLFTRCISSSEAYAAVEWRVLIMVGCLLAFASAMEDSGTARYLAERIAATAGGFGHLGLLAGFYLLTLALTQPMSNQAAALVVLPIALRTAVELGLNPRAFAVTVALAASCSFITPLEPACLLVYGPGRYRFRDYFKAGLPLTLAVLVITLALVPRFWPLELPAAPAGVEPTPARGRVEIHREPLDAPAVGTSTPGGTGWAPAPGTVPDGGALEAVLRY